MKNAKNIGAFLIILIIIAITILGISAGSNDGKSRAERAELEKLATCVADSGAKFYGAYWCPVCMKQKKLFGNAAKQLPYVECALAGSRDKQTDVCVAENIERYPTWTFTDGTTHVGLLSAEDLAQKTSCDYTPTSEQPTVDETASSAR